MADEQAGKQVAGNQEDNSQEGQEEVRLGNILASKLLKKKTAEQAISQSQGSTVGDQVSVGSEGLGESYEPLEYDLSGGLLHDDTIDFDNSPLTFDEPAQSLASDSEEVYDLELPEEIEYGHLESGHQHGEVGEYEPVEGSGALQFDEQPHLQASESEYAEEAQAGAAYEQSYAEEQFQEPVQEETNEYAAEPSAEYLPADETPVANEAAAAPPAEPEEDTSASPAGLGKSKLMQKARHAPDVGEETGKFVLNKFVAKKEHSGADAKSGVASAAAGEAEKWLAEADEALAQRRYLAAEPLYAKALTALDKTGEDSNPLLVRCLDHAAENYFEMGKHKDALPLYRRLMVVREKVGAPDPEIIATMYQIALTCEKLSLNSEADSMYKRAFRLGQQSLVPGDPLLAKVLEGYGNMLVRVEGGGGSGGGGSGGAASSSSTSPPAESTATPAGGTSVKPESGKPAKHGIAIGSTLSSATPAASAPAAKANDKLDASAQRPSSLSADEIAMLNQLGLKNEAPAAPKIEERPVAKPPVAAPPPLAGPRATFAHLDAVGQQKPLFAKHEQLLIQDEIAEETAEPPKPKVVRPPLDVKKVSLLGGFCAAICLLLLGTVNYYQFDFSESKPRQVDYMYPPSYSGRSYKTLDGSMMLGFSSSADATRTLPNKERKTYKYKTWKGTPADDIELITGAVTPRDFVVDLSRAVKDSNGVIYFTPDCPESLVAQKMKDVLVSAQSYYRSKNAYPSDAAQLATIDIPYSNPVSGGSEPIPVTSTPWPSDYNPADATVKSKLETQLEDGGTVDGEPAAKPAQISAIASATQGGQIFIVHGRDRDGGLLKRPDGKIWVLIGKNGKDATPAAPLPDGADRSTQLRITKFPRVEFVLVLLPYLLIFGFGAASVFLGLQVLKARAAGEKKFGFPHLKFVWAIAITICALLLKIAPDPLGSVYVFIINALLSVGFIAILFTLLVNPPRMAKKPADES